MSENFTTKNITPIPCSQALAWEQSFMQLDPLRGNYRHQPNAYSYLRKIYYFPDKLTRSNRNPI